MRVIIFGATGTIGKQVTRRALSQGHEVTAFARNPDKLDVRHENLHLCAGDVMDTAAVNAAVKGHDAVMIVLGGGLTGTVRSTGTQHIVDAMHKQNVRRLICETTLGAGDSVDNLNFYWRYVMFGFVLRSVFKDHLRQEEIVKSSGLDWTIVRPAAFVDEPEQSTFKHGFSSQEKDLSLSIAPKDVAKFMLDQLTSKAYLHQMPGLSY